MLEDDDQLLSSDERIRIGLVQAALNHETGARLALAHGLSSHRATLDVFLLVFRNVAALSRAVFHQQDDETGEEQRALYCVAMNAQQYEAAFGEKYEPPSENDYANLLRERH